MLLVALGTDARAGQISGHVTDAEIGLPLPGAIVSVLDTTVGAVTDTEGRYPLTLPPGTWALEFSFISFATQEPTPLVALADSTLTLHIALQLRAISLSEIIVTPERIAIMGDVTGSHQTISKEEIQTIPQFGEDIFRAVIRQHFKLYLSGLEVQGYEQLPAIPVFVDWNIGNFRCPRKAASSAAGTTTGSASLLDS